MRGPKICGCDSSRKRSPSTRSFACALLLLFFTASFATALAQKKPTHIGAAERLEAEQRLSDLGYWTGPIDGELDPASTHALVAFQKMEGRRRDGLLSNTELEALRLADPPAPRDNTYEHIEVDVKRQVLMVVTDTGTATRVLPISSGNEQTYGDEGRRNRAHTPRGTFTVTRKINGWRRSRLGLLYFPSYIINGIAIHGSPSIPTYPASHGCIRIPMFAAKELSQMAPIGTVVVVYDD